MTITRRLGEATLPLPMTTPSSEGFGYFEDLKGHAASNITAQRLVIYQQ